MATHSSLGEREMEESGAYQLRGRERAPREPRGFTLVDVEKATEVGTLLREGCTVLRVDRTPTQCTNTVVRSKNWTIGRLSTIFTPSGVSLTEACEFKGNGVTGASALAAFD